MLTAVAPETERARPSPDVTQPGGARDSLAPNLFPWEQWVVEVQMQHQGWVLGPLPSLTGS